MTENPFEIKQLESLSEAAQAWHELRRNYGYEQIYQASEQALAGLALVATDCGPGPDHFVDIRQEQHINMFDLPTALFFKPSDKFGEVYGIFSGWFRVPAGYQYLGRNYRSLEHAYQASKFMRTSPALAQEIHEAKYPIKAKLIGRKEDNLPLIRTDWDEMKEMAMLAPAIAILHQHAPIRELLLSTGDAAIVEDTYGDPYWGRGPDFQGLNGLGRTWMMAREIIRLEKGVEVIQSICQHIA